LQAQAAAASQIRLEAIRARGVLTCGMAPDMPGFSIVRSATNAEGLDADLCRATAVKIFGSADRARFVALATIDDFRARADIDVVFHGLTWKAQREADWGVRFAAVTFYDGQTIVVRADDPATVAAALDGELVCVESGSIFAAVLRRKHPAIRQLEMSDALSALAAFKAGRCRGWSWDASSLSAALAGVGARTYRILPDRFSDEPLAPIVRAADTDLLAVLRATIAATLAAEAGGATGGSDYGRIYARNLAGENRVVMERGANRLVRDGGRMTSDSPGGPSTLSASESSGGRPRRRDRP
jgi:general L-amino acid transport system substrate-binding protein